MLQLQAESELALRQLNAAEDAKVRRLAALRMRWSPVMNGRYGCVRICSRVGAHPTSFAHGQVRLELEKKLAASSQKFAEAARLSAELKAMSAKASTARLEPPAATVPAFLASSTMRPQPLRTCLPSFLSPWTRARACAL